MQLAMVLMETMVKFEAWCSVNIHLALTPHLLLPSPTLPVSALQASVVAQTVLADNVAGLANGTITTTEFTAATSKEALQEAISAASLPGASILPEDQKDKSNAVALGVGLGVGLGVPVLAGAGFAFWYYKVRPAGGRSGLSQPMI